MSEKCLVTSALLYANGPLHLGHLVEYIQADIWVRLRRMLGDNCVFICGDDAHGTPIMLSAQKQGITPEVLIETVLAEHKKDFADFLVEFDNYYTTHSEENRQLTELIYQRLQANDDIESHTIKQAYDPVEKIFLPDRYVKGTCPRCGAADQYGDNCESCGATYSPTDLKDPVSAVSGSTPIEKESLHYFFRADKYQDMLLAWLDENHLQPAVKNKLKEWFAVGLHPWDISRDAPYFGFKIPDTEDKYFYVWLDAPIGYMASFKNLCERREDLDFDDYWKKDSNVKLYHFIGKDIVNFHSLFWPAILHSASFRLPTHIFVHGYLTVDGKKMSKSRGTFITGRHYLTHLDPEYLRYYYAAKLSSGVVDIDLNPSDFMQRVNSDVVGKVVNIASRCAGFINKHFKGKLTATLDNPELFDEFNAVADDIKQAYLDLEYNHAVRLIMQLADRANQYIDRMQPWVLIKQPEQADQVQAVCSMGLNLFRLLIIYLKPILPNLSQKTEAFLNIAALTWQDGEQPLLDHSINPFTPLMQRIQREQIEALLQKEVATAGGD